MGSQFCPKCGTPRVGAFRFCRSCQFDFDEISGSGPAGSALSATAFSPPTTAQSPVSRLPATPQSNSEQYAASQGIGTPPTPTATAPTNQRRRKVASGPSRGLLAVAAVVVLGIGLVGLALLRPGSGPMSYAEFSAKVSAYEAAIRSVQIAGTTAKLQGDIGSLIAAGQRGVEVANGVDSVFSGNHDPCYTDSLEAFKAWVSENKTQHAGWSGGIVGPQLSPTAQRTLEELYLSLLQSGTSLNVTVAGQLAADATTCSQ